MAKTLLDEVRAAAARYPEAEKAFLFGDHEVYRVRKKVFVWLGTADEGGTYVSVKLKDTQDAALTLPFTEPASYGMAKYGWVAATFPKGKQQFGELVRSWLDESYRHTAPKRLVKLLDGGAPAPAPKAKAKAKAPAKAKAKTSRSSPRSR
jgi:predicted DNA-binding protein (MmcQ/YjbR family)